MYAYLKGTFISLSPTAITLEVQGIGYFIQVGPNTLSRLPQAGQTITIYTSFVVRENAHSLFGFLCPEEKSCFETLISVSGIGPKTALCLLGHLGLDRLKKAVEHNDPKAICMVPGIGKKTAERLLVEIKDKNLPTKASENHHSKDTLSLHDPLVADAISALTNLGYKQPKAEQAVKLTMELEKNKELDLALLITQSLKRI